MVHIFVGGVEGVILGESSPEVGEALVEDVVAAELVEALELVFEEGLKVGLQHALVIEPAQRLAVRAVHGHVLVLDHVYRRLQRDLPVLVRPALRHVVQLRQVDQLAPAPSAVALPPEDVIAGVCRRFGRVLVDDCNLIVRRLTPPGELLSVHRTQKHRQRLIRLAVPVRVHLQLPLEAPDLEHIAASTSLAPSNHAQPPRPPNARPRPRPQHCPAPAPPSPPSAQIKKRTPNNYPPDTDAAATAAKKNTVIT
eukprot:2231448-Rhodomonas_salina.1